MGKAGDRGYEVNVERKAIAGESNGSEVSAERYRRSGKKKKRRFKALAGYNRPAVLALLGWKG
jgi:hypothetical protein